MGDWLSLTLLTTFMIGIIGALTRLRGMSPAKAHDFVWATILIPLGFLVLTLVIFVTLVVLAQFGWKSGEAGIVIVFGGPVLAVAALAGSGLVVLFRVLGDWSAK